MEDMKRGCFVAGTPVLTKDGWQHIQKLQVGDLVLSRPADGSGQAEYKPVTRTLAVENRTVCFLTVDNGTGDGYMHVFVGDEHPFWVEGLGWTPARLLEQYHTLQREDGTPAVVAYNDVVIRTPVPHEGWVPFLPGCLFGSIWSFAEPVDFVRRDVSVTREPGLLDIWEGDDPRLKTTLYNIEVADFHTYYASYLWVHDLSPHRTGLPADVIGEE